MTKGGFCRVGDVDYSVPPGLSGRRLQIRVSTTARRCPTNHRRSGGVVVSSPAMAKKTANANKAVDTGKSLCVDVANLFLVSGIFLKRRIPS